MSEKIAKEGLLDMVYESIAQGKLSPEQALDFFSKMDIDGERTLAILGSLSAGDIITAVEAKEEISFLAMYKRPA